MPALYCINYAATLPSSLLLAKAILTVLLGNNVLGGTSTTALGLVFTSKKVFLQEPVIKSNAMNDMILILLFIVSFFIND